MGHDLSDDVDIRARPGNGGRPIPPRAALSTVFCPQCGDHPLHEDMLFDAITPDGQRVCAPCGALDALKVG